MHGRGAKSVLRISRSEIRSNTDGKRLSTALQLAALKVAESHQTSSNKQGYDMATLTHGQAPSPLSSHTTDPEADSRTVLEASVI